MSGPEEDELESYLQRCALRSHRSCQADSSYQAYQETLEPPPELDRIVLRKARLAVQNRHPQGAAVAPPPSVLPVANPRPAHRARWYAPASVAATMLVCMTVLVDIGAHALRGDDGAGAVPLHESATESVAAQTSDPVLAKVADEDPAPAPIPEVVIRAARLTTHPVSGAPRSAGPASR